MVILVLEGEVVDGEFLRLGFFFCGWEGEGGKGGREGLAFVGFGGWSGGGLDVLGFHEGVCMCRWDGCNLTMLYWTTFGRYESRYLLVTWLVLLYARSPTVADYFSFPSPSGCSCICEFATLLLSTRIRILGRVVGC